jgi:hypothetical protein
MTGIREIRIRCKTCPHLYCGGERWQEQGGNFVLVDKYMYCSKFNNAEKPVGYEGDDWDNRSVGGDERGYWCGC